MGTMTLKSRQILQAKSATHKAAETLKDHGKVMTWSIFEYRSKRELMWIKACLCALPVLFVICQIVWSVT